MTYQIDRVATLAAMCEADRTTEANLKAKSPAVKWRCSGDYVTGSAKKNRLNYWVRSSPVNANFEAKIGIGEWRIAQATGASHEEAIDRCRLRFLQMLKDFEEVF